MACTISCRLHSVVQEEEGEEASPRWVVMVMAATIDKIMARFDQDCKTGANSGGRETRPPEGGEYVWETEQRQRRETRKTACLSSEEMSTA